MWVDPLAAGLISLMILGCTVPLLQQSAETLLQRTPRVLVRTRTRRRPARRVSLQT